MADRSYLSIGQVLDLLKREFPDLTISKIRFLESQGLLDPERTPSGYRKFYGADIERLRFILREQQQHYLPLKVIKGRLGMDPDADPVLHPGPDADEQGEDAAAGDLTAMAAGAVAPRSGPPTRSDAPPSGPAASEGPVGIESARPRPGSRRLAPALEVVPAAPAAPASEWDGPSSMTLDELAANAGLSVAELTELERFGLITGRRIGGTTYYDGDCVEIAGLAATFRTFGVQARHLRMYRTAVEREAGFFEQVVTPMLKQRNPQARRQAVDTLTELSRLGHAMRAAVLRQALREYTGGG
ncbi:MAG: MerR family transcriptional regulator [Acidimicrobiales bacterium]